MGGTIELESQLNVGTTFTITIPFEIDASYEEREEEKRKISEKELSGVKVLLAEGNKLNMEIAVFILEKYGMEVVPARNGKEAVDLFASSRNGEFKVILMDVMMPVMDGLTATREICALPREDAKAVPIFAMTANAFSEDMQHTLAAGMNAHISKPVDMKLLKKTIRNIKLGREEAQFIDQ